MEIVSIMGDAYSMTVTFEASSQSHYFNSVENFENTYPGFTFNLINITNEEERNRAVAQGLCGISDNYYANDGKIYYIMSYYTIPDGINGVYFPGLQF